MIGGSRFSFYAEHQKFQEGLQRFHNVQERCAETMDELHEIYKELNHLRAETWALHERLKQADGTTSPGEESDLAEK